MRAGDKGVKRGATSVPWNWECRKRAGRRKKFETPQHLADAVNSYFAWVRENPILEAKPFNVAGKVEIVDVPKHRAMTIGGLCIHLGISRMNWSEYRHKRGAGYSAICDQADNIIITQKVEGAAADIFNTHLITRELGLADRHKHGGDDDPDSGPLQVNIVRYGDGKKD